MYCCLQNQEVPKSLSHDVDDLIATAVRDRPDLSAEVARLRQSEAEQARAHADWFPVIGVSANYSQQNWWYTQPWVWSNGGNILNADHTAAVLDRPEAQEGWQWMVDLVSRYKVMPSAADLKAGGSRRPMFYAGRLASVMDVTAFATVLDAYPDVPWNVAALPRGKAAATTRSGTTTTRA